MRSLMFVLASCSLLMGQQETQAANAARLILVVGADGTTEYGERHRRWAEHWMRAAEKSVLSVTRIGVGVDEELADKGGMSDRDRFLQVLDDLGDVPDSDQEAVDLGAVVWIVMIGHGTFADGAAKFNLRGPDVEAKEIRARLEKVALPIVLLNNSSSSGPFVNALSGDDRIIVTATKSGEERDFARFGGYLAAAIGDAGADLDHDDEVSILEAFLKASAETDRFYLDNNRIASEQALLDDNGDGLGTPAKYFDGLRVADAAIDADSGRDPDGRIAWRFTLIPSETSGNWSSEQLTQREQIETKIETLRQNKDDIPEAEYWDQLKGLLLEQAGLYQKAGHLGSRPRREDSDDSAQNDEEAKADAGDEKNAPQPRDGNDNVDESPAADPSPR